MKGEEHRNPLTHQCSIQAGQDTQCGQSLFEVSLNLKPFDFLAFNEAWENNILSKLKSFGIFVASNVVSSLRRLPKQQPLKQQPC